MDQPVVKIRDPWPPHNEIGVADVGALNYGFAIGQSTQVQFNVSRADPNAAGFQEGAMMSIERPHDNAHLWVGFISDAIDDLAGPVSLITCTDIFGTLFAGGREANAWGVQEATVGEVIRRILGEANARAEPPLLVELPITAGPRIDYQPTAKPLTDFMRTMVDHSDWEWEINSEIRGVGLRHRLLSVRRRGRDLSGSVIFEDGQHFTDARLHRKASAYIRSALAVGGSGEFTGRPAAVANVAGTRAPGLAPSFADGQRDSSPALMGTRVLVDPAVTNRSALQRAASRLHHSTEFVRHTLTFTLHETNDVAGIAAFDVTKLEMGSLYRCRFEDLALGKKYDRVVRMLGFSFDTATGNIPCVVEVQKEFDVAAT